MRGHSELTLFLCGDVMSGRGVDQVLPHPCPPRLYEPVLTSAIDYVALAEQANGPIPRRVEPSYVWGAALDVLERVRPDARIINLETSVTTSGRPDPKGINYRMHPENSHFLTAARIDCCALANNHVLDWGRAGLLETVETLVDAGVAVAGAGRDLQHAREPAVLATGAGGRVLVFAFGAVDSGIPRSWGAAATRPGVHLLADFSDDTVARIATLIAATKRPGDVAVASIHWGRNWGLEVPAAHRRFAHALIDRALVDVVHGHSSHHPKAIEVYRERPILYGCGDFLNDYEGIRGYETFRGDLSLMYFLSLDATSGRLIRLEMAPLQMRRLRLNHPSRRDRRWLRDTLERESRRFGHRIELRDTGLLLHWKE